VRKQIETLAFEVMIENLGNPNMDYLNVDYLCLDHLAYDEKNELDPACLTLLQVSHYGK
jgi:hypothetical protein